MSRVSVRIHWQALAGAFLLTILLAAALASSARADQGWQDDNAHWLCKPGLSPDPCAGSLDGRLTTAGVPGPDPLLGYKKAADPKVDCFYVYPTQSEQKTPNANWDKDAELLRPTINQAAQFSRHCRVFAPMYRQYTQWALDHPEEITPEVRDLAYNDVKAAWEKYLDRYNEGRGVIILSHSQGTMHMAWLMSEMVDNNPEVRAKIIAAYLIGGNVYVPKGKLVGGQFKHMPACTSGSETGCIVAYSSFQEEPAMNSAFGRAGTGYWINPNPAPDPATDEIMCVDPASLSGDGGKLRTLANLGAFMAPKPEQTGTPWSQYDGYFTSTCKNENDASWLQVDRVPGTADPLNLADLVGTSNGSDPHGNLHVGDVNLALGNLVTLAGAQSEAWLDKEAQRLKQEAQRNKLLKQQKKLKKSLKQLKKKAAKSQKQCRRAKTGSKAKRANCRKARQSKKQVKKTGAQLKKVQRRLKQLG